MRPKGSTLTEQEIAIIVEMCEEGASGQGIADQIGVSKTTVCNYLKSAGLRPAAIKGPPVKKLPEYIDYSTLPKDTVFDPKMFPVF